MSVRDQILKASPFRSETIHVAEWGVDVEVRSLPLAQRNRLLTQLKELGADDNITRAYPLIVIATAFDPETGEKLFDDDEADVVNGLSSEATDRIAKVALKMLGFTQETLDVPKGDS